MQTSRSQSLPLLLLVVTLLSLPAISWSQLCFEDPQTYGGGAQPRSLVSADVNGDGVTDLIVGATNVSILLGQGNFEFQAPRAYDVTWNADAINVGDLNSNGTLDLVVSRLGSSAQQMILYNGGDAQFQETLLSKFPGSRETALADFNNDGHLDMAAAIPLTHQVVVLAGDGLGGFQTVGAVPSLDVWDIVHDDLDGDGDQDLLVTAGSGADIGLRTYLNDGSGQISLHGEYLMVGAGGLATADFNQDGSPDVVTNGATVRLGDGLGGFGPPTSYYPDDTATTLAIDANNDNQTDLVVADRNQAVVAVLLGNGPVGFASPISYAIGGPTTLGQFSLVAADFDQDNDFDLAHLSRDTAHVSILANDGTGSFSHASWVSLLPNPVHSLLPGDYDADGSHDIAFATAGTSGALDGLVVAQGDGSGSWLRIELLPLPFGVSQLVSGDFDQNGYLDIVAASPLAGMLTLVSGGGSLGPTLSSLPAGPAPAALATLDADGDGLLDLIVADSSSQTMEFWRGLGNGSFASPALLAAGRDYSSLAVGDVDGDGHQDLCCRSWDGTQRRVEYRAGNGNGTFSLATEFLANSQPRLHVGDFDQDGRDDLLIQEIAAPTAVLRFGTPAGPGGAVDLGWGGDWLHVDDFDGDAQLDVIAAGQLYRGDGSGNFDALDTDVTWTQDFREVRSVDLNGDGWSDLVALSWLQHEFGVALNRSPGAACASVPIDCAAPDCNDNGIADACDIQDGTSVDANGNGVPDECESQFIRGACDGSPAIDVADIVAVLDALFERGPAPFCLASCDSNGDGSLDLADAVVLALAVFGVNSGLPDPFPECGLGGVLDFSCAAFACP